MALTVPTTEPRTFRQGELVSWTRSLSNFPASAWTLIYTFRSPSHSFAVTAAADGDGHVASIAASASADIPAGDYTWQAIANDGALDFKQVDAGRLTVDKDLALADDGYDTRTFNKRMLDAIEARLEGTADRDDISYSTEGLSVSRYSPEQLTERWRHYRALVVQEERQALAANGDHHGGRIFTRLP
jgi:hypothetical protein